MKVIDLIQRLMEYPEDMKVVGYAKNSIYIGPVHTNETWCSKNGVWLGNSDSSLENIEDKVKVLRISVE